MTPSTPRRAWIAIIGLFLIAYLLRVFHLDSQSIWWDEGISLHLATSSLRDILADRLNNIHPPLYFILLKGWLGLVGVSPFTGRYLSALAAFLQVALVIAFTRTTARGVDYLSPKEHRLLKLGVLPWIAGILIALSPLSVIYAQEIRVYAMLPLAFLAILFLTFRSLRQNRTGSRLLILLIFVEWIGLHLHYILLFGVAYAGLWGSVVFIRRRDWQELFKWVGSHLIVLALSLPWLIAVLNNWSAVEAEANAGTFVADPVPLGFLLAQVWAFHLTGLAGALASSFVRAVAAVTAVAGLFLFIWRVYRPSPEISEPSQRKTLALEGERRVLLRSAAQWLVPLLSGLVVWSVRSFSHPRYISAFAIAFIPLAAWLTYPLREPARRVIGPLFVLAVLVLSGWGLSQYYFNPERAKPDLRGAANYLEEIAESGDIILIPNTDWSFPFEYSGDAGVIMVPDLRQSGGDIERQLLRTFDCPTGDDGNAACQRPAKYFVIDYPRGTRDWQKRVPFELERRGSWLEQVPFNGVVVNAYQMDQGAVRPDTCDAKNQSAPSGAGFSFDTLNLDSVWIEEGAAADTAVTVALCWQATQPIADTLSLSLAVRDPITGERLGQTDSVLVDRSGAPTTAWPANEAVITYHIVPLAPGTPPIDVVLNGTVYSMDGTEQRLLVGVDSTGHELPSVLTLGRVSLASPEGLASSPYDVVEPPRWVEPVDLAPGLQFLGTYGLPTSVRPGQTLRIPLYWRAGSDDLPDIRPLLAVEQDGDRFVELGAAPVQGRYPTDRWRAGQTILEFRDLRIPTGIAGPASLALYWDDRRLELGKIRIDSSGASFERPDMVNPVEVNFNDVARLIGVDVPEPRITNGVNFPITLYWESLSSEIATGYTVFVHLLAEDGRLVAQHDGIPAMGQRPIFDWLAGEYIVDRHMLEWREPEYSGPARIRIGLYDPLSGERLLTTEGDDGYLLPETFVVEPPPE